MLKDRVSQIDVDCPKKYRPLIYNHIFDKFGTRKVAYVLALGTISDKGTIDDIGRALSILWDKEHPNDSNNPYSLDIMAQIKNEYEENPEECKRKHPKIFYYFDGLVNTVISISVHPAGIIISCNDLIDNYGTIEVKDRDTEEMKQTLCLDMNAAHAIQLCKYDILGLDTVDIVNKTCEYAGIDYPHTYEVDFNDKETWDNINKAPYGLFQFNSKFAFQCLSKYHVKSVEDMCLINALIRPGAASFRESVLNHEFYHNSNKNVDKLFFNTLGRLLYQEETLSFLMEICGMSGGQADTLRRAIGHKDKDFINAKIPEVIDGYCNNSDKPKSQAAKEAEEYIQVLQDSASYQFGFGHSAGYSILSYYCAYCRTHYPYEYATAFLNCADKDNKILEGTELAKFLGINIKQPRFRYSRADYFFDKTDHCIYKGIASLKYCNQAIGEELYNIRNMKFDSFTDFLVYATEQLSINSRQLDILIKLNFFSEFGGNKKLSTLYAQFSKGKSQYKKTYCDKTKVKRIAELKAIEDKLPDEIIPFKEQLIFEQEILGSPVSTYNVPRGQGWVMEINTKYSPRLKIYGLTNGYIMDAKIDKKTFAKNQLTKGCVIQITGHKVKPKMQKTEDGFKAVSNTKEFWLTKYQVIHY